MINIKYNVYINTAYIWRIDEDANEQVNLGELIKEKKIYGRKYLKDIYLIITLLRTNKIS